MFADDKNVLLHLYYGEKIGEENLQIKERLVNEYQPTAKGAIEAFGHMIPYENWVLEEDWK